MDMPLSGMVDHIRPNLYTPPDYRGYGWRDAPAIGDIVRKMFEAMKRSDIDRLRIGTKVKVACRPVNSPKVSNQGLRGA